MTLAHPDRLWFLLLGLPLVALFVVRRRPRPWPTAYLFLWRELSASRGRPRRYQDVRRLLWQLGLLALLSLALAGPHRGERVGPHRQLLVVDATASMGVDDRLVRGLERLASWCRPGTRTTLVVADPTPSVRLRDAGPEAVRRALARIRVRPVAGAIDELLASARGWGRDVDEVVVLSDGCGSGTWDAAGLTWLRPEAPAHPANLALERVQAWPRAGRRGWRVSAVVVNHGPEDASATVRLRDEAGEEKARAGLPLRPGQRRPVSVPVGEAIAGRLTIAVDGGDAFALDDVARLALPRMPKAVVTLVTQRRVGGKWRPWEAWQPALKALAEQGWIDEADEGNRFTSELPAVPPSTPERLQVVIMDEVRLRGPLPPGNYLLFGVRGGPAPLAGLRSDLSVWAVDRRHPLMLRVELAELQIFTGGHLRVPRGAQVLARGASGPLAAAQRSAGGAWVAFGFPLARSTLWRQPAYMLVMKNALVWFAQSARPWPAAAPLGEALPELPDARVARSDGPGWDVATVTDGERPVAVYECGRYFQAPGESALAMPAGPDATPSPVAIGPPREDYSAQAALAALAWLVVGLLVPPLWASARR